MQIFEQGHVVRVPFPYTDRNTRQRRPALVVSAGALGDAGVLLWVAMITSTENRGWPGDYDLGPDYRDFGLPVASIVRPSKIATIEVKDAELVGRIQPFMLKAVQTHIRRSLGVS